ncbi:protein maelstrom homolog [Acyrthosiphon pisum]|uniref:Maelstrom domain-containing protein n=1 Tax=Acyrthosiphon pisum TaxID=7029 RepID=A0A8R2NQC5_ACYPI|nr:protein maelstrom homolog [Acyrthosiphon pisum]|eukprot:XP_008184140.1 PREDICTED: protein maelstrom homolog [Acyrthosiphon pisum]
MRVNHKTNAMYSYIDVLLSMQPASYYLPKQKFILIHINPYTCEKEGFYFPAEISMAEFSLEKGLIRMFHQLVGFDQVKTNAPRAPTADINNHAANNHKINVFSMFPNNYSEILLKMIGFIMNKEVDVSVLNDLALDMPPVYTAHTPIENELMITSSSLFKLFESAVRDAERTDFNNIIRVYHLDKLFMELKNACYKVKHPGTDDLALPSVAMATDSLSKDVLSTIKTIGCHFHEKLEHIHGCSNYFVCKWINILSAHCCRFIDIELVSGCHYDFDLSKTESPLEECFDKINISKFAANYSDDREINKPNTLAANSFPALEGKLATVIQKPIWNKPEYKANTNSKTITNKEHNFPPLGDSKSIQINAPVPVINSWCKNAGRGKGIISQVQSNNQNQLNANSKQTSKGRGLSTDRNK